MFKQYESSMVMTLYNSGFLLPVQFSDLLESVFLCAGYENVAVMFCHLPCKVYVIRTVYFLTFHILSQQNELIIKIQ